MIVDARSLGDGERLTADVCIIGGGPAGLTVADGLRGSGLSVVVLESGGEEPDGRTQELAAGELTGDGFRFNGAELELVDTRLRLLGGTSNHWTGMCRPLDGHDFEPRAAIAMSGWPFSFDELNPYYERAVTSCELATSEWSAAAWSDLTQKPLLLDDDPVRTAVFQFSPPTLFGSRLRPALAESADVRVVLWANVVELESAPDSARIESVRALTLDGAGLNVDAEVFVLASGAIEVPRLLLASNAARPGGVGNSSDLVGRCFMEHPHVIAGRGLLSTPYDAESLYLIVERSLADGAREHTWAGLALTADAQREADVGNGVVLFWAGLGGPARGARDDDTTSAEAVGALVDPGSEPPDLVALSARVEQEPNPENRVTLSSRKDALGQPRAAVQWSMSDRDWRTVRGTIEGVAAALGEAGLARIEIDPSGVPLEEWPIEIGNHHMGTTRTHVDPSAGVVDPDLRMHDIENLFVCGSSVFPTSGMANPTLTIVALAHRLADNLRGLSF